MDKSALGSWGEALLPYHIFLCQRSHQGKDNWYRLVYQPSQAYGKHHNTDRAHLLQSLLVLQSASSLVLSWVCRCNLYKSWLSRLLIVLLQPWGISTRSSSLVHPYLSSRRVCHHPAAWLVVTVGPSLFCLHKDLWAVHTIKLPLKSFFYDIIKFNYNPQTSIHVLN